MTWTLRPAVRENTPLIIGLAGPTKSGKTYSAHRLAIGLAGGGMVAMLNAEGPRGHQYADKFSYQTMEIQPPYSPTRYTEAVEEIAKATPAVLIVDSATHMHDGPGGLLEWHEAELDRMAGQNLEKRGKATWAAWIKPKAAENRFIYALKALSCPVILCFRAKEKLKIIPGRDPINLGWQPISGDAITFETIFTLVLPPHCKGVPDLDASEMREPFDTMIPKGRAIDEALGQELARWAVGKPAAPDDERSQALAEIKRLADDLKLSKDDRQTYWNLHVGKNVKAEAADVSAMADLIAALRRKTTP